MRVGLSSFTSLLERLHNVRSPEKDAMSDKAANLLIWYVKTSNQPDPELDAPQGSVSGWPTHLILVGGTNELIFCNCILLISYLWGLVIRSRSKPFGSVGKLYQRLLTAYKQCRSERTTTKKAWGTRVTRTDMIVMVNHWKSAQWLNNLRSTCLCSKLP